MAKRNEDGKRFSELRRLIGLRHGNYFYQNLCAKCAEQESCAMAQGWDKVFFFGRCIVTQDIHRTLAGPYSSVMPFGALHLR